MAIRNINNQLKIITILFVPTICALLYLFIVMGLNIYYIVTNSDSYIIFDYVYLHIFLGILVLSYWIYCLYLWSKYDKSISRLLLLLLIYWIYSPIYYFRIRRILKSKI